MLLADYTFSVYTEPGNAKMSVALRIKASLAKIPLIKAYGKFFFLIFLILLVSSCSRVLGYGVLLWSSEDPSVPSGTVLPVYIRSNIDKVWVVGIPAQFRTPDSRVDKFEIPLSKLELAGSKKKAQERAENFSRYALVYAETLQDGLPIREHPDNGARRVYRLKLGEIIKILSLADGVVAVGASGDPLPGEWYVVLTEEGISGYCFSYRLRLFDHMEGSLAAIHDQQEAEDPVLDRILSRIWSPDTYGTMVNTGRINLEELSRQWHFDPGPDTGIARIFTGDLDIAFDYTKIRSTGTQSWRFEGSPLQMNLRSETTLAVQFTEANGILRTLLFVALPTSVDDIILQETASRDWRFQNIYENGPAFISTNYGTLRFQEDRRFTWTGYSMLVPLVIPASALGSGSLEMRLFLSTAMSERYNGAFTLRFDGIGGVRQNVDFMYNVDSQGLRIEYVPQTSLDDITVVRRASSPTIVNFFRLERPDDGTFVPGGWDFFPETFGNDPFGSRFNREGAEGLPPETE